MRSNKNSLLTLVCGCVLTGCGAKVDQPNNPIVPVPQSGTVLQVGAVGQDIVSAPKNFVEFDSFPPTGPATHDLDYQSGENRAVQVLIYSSSANSGCDLSSVQSFAEWTPDGASATRVATGDAVLPGDNFTLAAGTHYKFRFIANPASGCQNATFQFAVVTPASP